MPRNSDPPHTAQPEPRVKRGYGGISAADRDAMRRDGLVAAAIARFGEGGYTATTIESLCGDARVSTRDFYSYFKTKEDLLLAVYDHIIEQSMNAVVQAVSQAYERAEGDPIGVIRAGINAFAESMARDERWARINFIEVVGVSARVERRRREAIHDFAQLVKSFTEPLAERGLIDPTIASPVTSVAMVGAIHETLTDWVIQRDRPSLEFIVDELTALFEAVIRR